MNVKQTIKSSLLALPLAFSTPLIAQEDVQDDAFSPRWEWGISIGTMGIDEESATIQEIGDSADYVLGFSADYSTQRWLTSISLDWVSYDDKAGFSQRTQNSLTGQEDDSSSSADGFLLSAAFGPQWRFGTEDKASVFVQAGFSTMFGSERSIPNCTNCQSKDIDIDGGVFAKAGLMYQTGQSVAIGINTIQYLSSDDLEGGFNFVIKYTR